MASCIVFPAVPLLKLKANCLHCWLLQAPTRSSFCSYSNIWDICQKYFLVKYFQFLNSSASGKLFLGCCQAHLIVSNLTWTALSKITLENSWQDSPLQICGVGWRVFFFVLWGGGEYIIYPEERQYGTPDQYHGTRTLRTGRGKNLTTHKFSTLISNSWTRMAKKKSFSTCFFLWTCPTRLSKVLLMVWKSFTANTPPMRDRTIRLFVALSSMETNIGCD